MLRNRVIPCLLLKDGGLIKTERFKSPKYVGDPLNAIRIFNEKQVDELMVLDVAASKRPGGEPDYALIEQMAGECFMPLCYGGGIRTLDQADRVFAFGVEKICVQAAAYADLDIVRQIAAKWGNQAVVVSVDVKRKWLGGLQRYAAATGKTSGDWLDFVQAAIDAGAGELLVNAVDRDGTMEGLDLDMISRAARVTNVPVIAAGGTASLQDIRAGVDAGASAIAVGAFFVFHGPHRAVLITYPTYDELTALLKRT